MSYKEHQHIKVGLHFQTNDEHRDSGDQEQQSLCKTGIFMELVQHECNYPRQNLASYSSSAAWNSFSEQNKLSR